MSLYSKLTAAYRSITPPVETPEEVTLDRVDETTTPNMRALRLAMTIADYLLSMNIPVSEVTDVALTITDRYCTRKVSIEIIATVLMFSQDRGNDLEPLTLIQAVTPRPVNSALIQSIQEVARDIKHGKLRLDDAESQLEKIIEQPKSYPLWLQSIGNAAISAGIGALLSGSFQIIALSFLTGGFISYITLFFSKRHIPTFFTQAAAAVFATLVAALFTWLGSQGFTYFQGIDPNLIIIGGIIMLFAGVAVIGAIEDAIDEYYLTANARILKVIMLTIGIVLGIAVGLYIATKLGINMSVNTEKRIYDEAVWQYIGAAIIAAGYALSVNTRFIGILLAALVGVAGWAVYAATAPIFSFLVASFLSAAVVGAISAMLARWLRTPPTILITAGIIALAPGLSLFNGLMAVIVGVNGGDASLDAGALVLMNALFIALAIAAGASFGNLVARPLRRSLLRARNALPHRPLRR